MDKFSQDTLYTNKVLNYINNNTVKPLYSEQENELKICPLLKKLLLNGHLQKITKCPQESLRELVIQITLKYILIYYLI